MTTRREFTLEEVCSRITDGAHNSPPSVPEGRPMASVKDLTRFGICLDTCRRITSADFEKLVRQGCQPIKGDVLIAKDGATALDTVCEVKQNDGVVLLSSVAILRPNPSLVDSSFLRYYLDSSKTRSYLKSSFISGAAIPRVVLKDLKRAVVRIPPLPIQRCIAGILSAYDDLIENNLRRIKILEEMARLVYREWFVHFRFPGHENVRFVDSPLRPLPDGWTIRNLKEIANVIYGYPFQSKKFNTVGNGSPIVRIRDIPAGATETFTDERTESKYRIDNGSILVGMDGDFHMCIWSGGGALQNQRVARFESCSEIGNHHLFLALEKPIQEFNKAIVGTTVAHLGEMHLKTIQLIWPPVQLLAKARETLEPLSELIINLRRQTSVLRRTRDLLLPRLLSGEIELRDVNSESLQVKGDDQVQIENRVDESESGTAAENEDRDAPPQQAALPTIDQTDRTDVLAVIRQIFSDGFAGDRDDVIRAVARQLGYHRTGNRIQQILGDDLRTAVRRGILDNDNGQLRLLARSITDYDRDFLKKQFLAAIERGWIERDEAIQTFARWLGFRRTGPVIDETARSLINGLIREGRLEGDRSNLIRRAS